MRNEIFSKPIINPGSGERAETAAGAVEIKNSCIVKHIYRIEVKFHFRE